MTTEPKPVVITMVWTDVRPTKPGFYWVECFGVSTGKRYVQVAKVYSSDPKEPTHVDTVYIEGDNHPLDWPGNIRFWSPEPLRSPDDV
jgi:hypothetical protein